MREVKKARSDRLKSVFSVAVLLIAVAVLMNALLGGRHAPTPEAFSGAPSYEAALEQARSENKVVFAVATADWCPPCQKYKRGALADERVAAWIRDNAVPVYFDATDGSTTTMRELGVEGIPASFVIDANGEVLARRSGAVSASSLLSWLDGASGVQTAGAGP